MSLSDQCYLCGIIIHCALCIQAHVYSYSYHILCTMTACVLVAEQDKIDAII